MANRRAQRRDASYEMDKQLFAPPKRAKAPTKIERDQKRKTKSRSEAGKMARQTQLRQKWEQSPEGQQRMRTANQGLGGTEIPVGQLYALRGWGESKKGPMVGEQQLPGLENPYEAPTPSRWEDLPAKEQTRAQRALKLRSGADLGSMQRSFGAQLDQSYERAERNLPKSAAVPAQPWSQNFYNEGEPAQVMRRSAEAEGVPFGAHTAMNAFTSPQTKFKQGDRYPNDDTARAVERQVRAGVSVPAVTTGQREDNPELKNQGFDTNARRAADVFQQVESGVPMQEVQTRYDKHGTLLDDDKRRTPFGPKTGPYQNAWQPDVPDFFVADVHSGGGGMLPHLSSDKPVTASGSTYESGDPKRDKSQREKVLESVPHFHSMADYAARQAMSERNLGRTRQAQASQWGEEQIRRTERNPRLALAKESEVYPAPAPRREIPGQGDLFKGTPAKETISLQQRAKAKGRKKK